TNSRGTDRGRGDREGPEGHRHAAARTGLRRRADPPRTATVRGRPRRLAAHPLSPAELYAVSSTTEVDMDWMEYGFNGADAIRVVISCIAFYCGIILLL